MKKFVLIIGASGGIGRATAMTLAAKGYNLYLHYNKNSDAVAGLATELNQYGGEYHVLQGDLSEIGGYRQLISPVFELDAIVHCGGGSVYGLLQDLTDEEFESLMNVHVVNPILLIRTLLPKLIAKKSGNIVFVSSIWGEVGAACEAAYSAAKGAQLAFVKALAKETAPSGIRVNAVAPGAVTTNMLNIFSEAELEEVASEIPLGRLASPVEVANAISFLMSSQSSYITGHVLSVNGGWQG